MGDTVGLASNLCLGVGRVVVVVAWLALPVFCLAGKDLKLGLDSFLAVTLWVGCRCPFLPLPFTLPDPASLLGLFPLSLVLGLIILLSSFISWISASMSEGSSTIYHHGTVSNADTWFLAESELDSFSK